MVDDILDGQDETCTICGRPLGYNPDDQPHWPTGPMCGDCYQAREMDNDIWAADERENGIDEGV
jgi:hypothetical protein